jgi:hypothetical protein
MAHVMQIPVKIQADRSAENAGTEAHSQICRNDPTTPR